jgi:hypothetical protein
MTAIELNRREFVRAGITGAAGLTIAIHLPACAAPGDRARARDAAGCAGGGECVGRAYRAQVEGAADKGLTGVRVTSRRDSPCERPRSLRPGFAAGLLRRSFLC